MIISKTPFRISFSGGGSDIKDFYSQEDGAVLSTTINKYVFLSMHPLFNNNGFHLKYSENEFVGYVNRIKHPIIREVFSKYSIFGVDFNSSSDVPSGTGLGSSSSFTTGLINLCNAYLRQFMSKEEMAKVACEIEIDKLKSPIGKQDQYACAIGGMNFIEFHKDESVSVEKITLSQDKLTQLEDSLMLFYLGGVRPASSILGEQKKNTHNKIDFLRKMVGLSRALRDDLKNDYIDNFGRILNEGWMYKRELCEGITNATIDYWYNIAMDNGAQGGKVLGAGGGGFLLLCAPGAREALRQMIKLYELPFKFENSGTTIIY